MKVTSLFGGVQVINIIISIVKSKVIAILIGATGMGIASLINSSLSLIYGLTSFGLEKSAVKEISIANNKLENERISKTISVLKRLVWFTIVLGVVVILCFAPWLSEFSFGNREYTVSFLWISLALLFRCLTSSQLAILQGLRKLKSLAKANLYGNIISLSLTLPLYYVYKLDAIVPVIILSTFISFIVTFYYTNNIGLNSNKISNKETLIKGRGMIELGFTLSVSSMLSLLGAYILQIFISNNGGVDQVGLYQAGFLILNTYVGIIFNAMGTDYFPRLSAISVDILKIRKSVYEQAIIGVLLITPIIVVFLALAPIIIKILYSKDFLPILAMISWGILGMLFRLVSWSMGYIIIAKGDSKVFIKTAIGFNALQLLLCVLGYTYGGLEGLGFSYLIHFIVHFFSIKLITKYRYDFYFEKGFFRIFMITIILCTLSFLFTYIQNEALKYILMVILIITSLIFSYRSLDEKMDIKKLINELRKYK